MINSLMIFCRSRWTLSLKSTATLVACVGLTTGQVCVALTAQSGSAVNMGSINVGGSRTATVVFTFQTGGELNSTQPYTVVTQGLPGLDFTDASGSTCAANINYTTGATCSVKVKFSPKFPGGRYGAVNLYGSLGKIFATAYVCGVGTGPQVNFLPAVQSTLLFTGLSEPATIVACDSGNLYIADRANQRVLKATVDNGTFTQTTVADSSSDGLGQVFSIAVDGSGIVYVVDQDNRRLLKETPGPGGYIQSEIISPDSAYAVAVAVDGSGNVYFTDDNASHGGVLKLRLSGGAYTQSTIASVDLAENLAVDESGNVYYDDGFGNVWKLTLSGSDDYTPSSVVTDVSHPEQIAVDASGDVYVAQMFGNSVVEETPSGNGYTQSTVLNTGLHYPEGVAVGESGNIYIVDTYNDRVLRLEVAQPPRLTFAATVDGSISSDSPHTVTLTNTGNAALKFPVPGSGDNPSISSNFTLDSSSAADCPLTSSASSAPGVLAAGTSCLLPISFEPKSPAYGYVNGALKITDNNLNAAFAGDALQAIQITGRVPGAPPFGNLASPVDSVTGTNPVSQADSVKISGWVADPVDHAPMSNVAVYIDGTAEGKPTLGIAKQVVADEYGSADLDSGYQMLYPAASLSVGVHTVTVIAIDSGGNSKTFGPVSFMVSAAPAS
jgi:hypothetical protein